MEIDFEGDFEVDLEVDFEVDLEGDFRGDFRGDFKQDLEEELLSSSDQLRSRSGPGQVWFSIELKFNSFELDSEVGRLVVSSILFCECHCFSYFLLYTVTNGFLPTFPLFFIISFVLHILI